MTAYLEWLLADVSVENITIRVRPTTNVEHTGIASNFTVLHFADAVADSLLDYFDGPLGGYVISDAGESSPWSTCSMTWANQRWTRPNPLRCSLLYRTSTGGGGLIAVRNSNHPASVVLFTHAEMNAYLNGVKAGEFDDLT